MDEIATIAELLVKVSADSSGLRKELQASQRQLQRSFGKEAIDMGGSIATGMGLAATAMGAVGLAAIKMAANMEQNRIAFTTMMGSAQAAESFLASLATFAEKTPFEFTGLVDSSKRLLAYGYTAQEVIPMLTGIGDAVAAMGGSAEVLDRVTLAFGQMKAKGFVSGEEMRQLAEAGIPAWQFLANVIGKDIPTTMALAEKKALDANAAIAGMIDQMGTKYGGMMEKQSTTVLGMLSNMKDKAGNMMRDLGDAIVAGTDLKKKMQGTLTFLDNLSTRIKQAGVGQALMEMVPVEVELGIIAIAGAITALLLPALASAAIGAAKMIISLGPIALIGAAVALVVAGLAWSISETSAAAESAVPMLDSMTAYTSALGQVAERSAEQVSRFNSAVSGGLGAGNGSPEEYFAASGYKSPYGAKPPGGAAYAGGGGGGGGGGGTDPVKEAQRVSEAIEKEWVQTTQTKIQQLDIWQAEHLKDLEQTKAANENYERDKLRVASVYAERRNKILQEESDASAAMQTKIKDGYTSMQASISSFGQKGAGKIFADLATEQQNSMKSSKDYYDGIQRDFVTADNATKAEMLLNLQERGIQYKLTEQGNLDFSAARQADYLSILKNTRAQENEIHQTAADVRAGIDAAMQANSMVMLQEALTAENAMRLNDYTAQQSMMETYQAVALAANSTTAQLMANMYSGAFSGLSTAFSDIIMGTKTIGQAFQALGQSMLKIVADFVAKWLAGQIMMALFGKAATTASTAAAVVAGKATAAAWAPAASAVSLATFGGNSVPAMAGIGATFALTMGLSKVQGLASGGLTTGPSLNMIGEGRYQEAVLPLSDRVFEKLATGIGKFGGGNQISQTIYGGINTEVDLEDLMGDLGDMVSNAMMGA